MNFVIREMILIKKAQSHNFQYNQNGIRRYLYQVVKGMKILRMTVTTPIFNHKMILFTTLYSRFPQNYILQKKWIGGEDLA